MSFIKWRVWSLIVLGTFAVGRRESFSVLNDGTSFIHNVRDYGAKGDGKANDSVAIAHAIQAAADSAGGEVVFPPGIYVTGTLELRSNLTLNLEPGSVLQGSKDLGDYGSTEAFGFGHVYGVNSTGEGFKVGILVGRNIENVSIVGRGVIDGSADSFFDFSKPHYSMDFDPKYTRQGQDFMRAVLRTEDGPVDMKPEGRPGTMIICSNCRNVLMRDVTLRNAPNWTVHFNNTEHAVVSGIHIHNNLLLPNNDGFDCFGCKDVHFSDCGIQTGDDDFAILNSTDVTVANCSLTSRSSGIRVESTRNSTFENLVIHANRGIGIYGRGLGLTEHLIFTGLSIDTQLSTGHWWGKGEPIYIATAKPISSGESGRVRNVKFANISGDSESSIVLYGSPEAPIQDISFDNVQFIVRATRKDVNDAVGGNFDLRWTSTKLENAVFKHNIPGLYGRYFDGLSIRDFRIQWGANTSPNFSNAIECEDFKRLDIDGFEGSQAPDSERNEAISMRRGSEVSIRNSVAEPGTRVFLSAQQISGERVFTGNDLSRAQQAFEDDAGGFRLYGNYLPKRVAK